jgi:hypothetical protein
MRDVNHLWNAADHDPGLPADLRGEEPWIALGNFRNAWYGYAKDSRAALVSEPLAKPAQNTDHTRRWSAFCAATVEFLCERYGVPYPAWVHDPRYTLETP